MREVVAYKIMRQCPEKNESTQNCRRKQAPEGGEFGNGDAAVFADRLRRIMEISKRAPIICMILRRARGVCAPNVRVIATIAAAITNAAAAWIGFVEFVILSQNVFRTDVANLRIRDFNIPQIELTDTSGGRYPRFLPAGNLFRYMISAIAADSAAGSDSSRLRRISTIAC